jgi:NAD(P)-dependent dehydrogenase (short-subunit alcohol dehydrogenase family)
MIREGRRERMNEVCAMQQADRDAAGFGVGCALVVGGSGGVGQAICEALARRGSDVAVAYRENRSAAEAVVRGVEACGRRATSHALDVRDEAAARAVVTAVSEAHGQMHTIVHAAGSKIDQPYVSQVDAAAWRDVFDADVHGFFHVMQAGLPELRRSRGSFVFISSAGIARHPPGDVLSVAPKAAVEALVRALAREEGRFGVRANSVALGIIEAGMFPELVARGELDPRYLAAAKRNIALGRFGTASEVGETVAFLASKAAGYITGQTLCVDGGYSV